MKWTKCGELEYVSEDQNAYVYYSNEESCSWKLDVDGEEETFDNFLSCSSAQHAYEKYIRYGRIDDREN